MFKFIHCADLHLDSPLKGLQLEDDAPLEEIRTATRKALENLVDVSIEESVKFIVIAGDIYDGDWQDYSTGLFFNSMMARLRDHGIKVFIIKGNHDAASQISKRLVLPDNVVEFRTDKPETYKIEDLHVAIHGWSYKEREVWSNMAIQYPDALPGYFNIGLLHTSLEGQAGHERYAPCKRSELIEKGYDYWALGHIHKRQVVSEKPYIIFPGNIQGRHIRETGEKGCTLVTVDGRDVTVEHRNLDVLRWYLCQVDLSDVTTDVDFTAKVSDVISETIENEPHPVAVRVVLHGRTDLHSRLLQERERYVSEVKNAAQISGGNQIWIEKVKFKTEPPYEENWQGEHKDAISEMINAIGLDELEDDFIDSYIQDIKAIQNRLSSYIKQEDAIRIEGKGDIDSILNDAKELLLGMVSKGGSAR
ncbi:metallophosphoesterase family protein [Fervidibacillus halotolerans]|uniref:DNA repair exonuclease n=1 Tax=Fervidibacillus halotolerans TaxID=2980027 RepID=A0A9E8S1E5_9BACI|nr:DNA repair exonuclease [Fervidibacillus halotolerans]WAA13442.1 DNA repair exonuclease [Fervidibacillus halotolerans]